MDFSRKIVFSLNMLLLIFGKLSGQDLCGKLDSLIGKSDYFKYEKLFLLDTVLQISFHDLIDSANKEDSFALKEIFEYGQPIRNSLMNCPFLNRERISFDEFNSLNYKLIYTKKEERIRSKLESLVSQSVRLISDEKNQKKINRINQKLASKKYREFQELLSYRRPVLLIIHNTIVYKNKAIIAFSLVSNGSRSTSYLVSVID